MGLGEGVALVNWHTVGRIDISICDLLLLVTTCDLLLLVTMLSKIY